MIRAYIGMGANLGEPFTQLDNAVNALHTSEHTQVVACSGVYRSAPVGPEGQDDYLNAVAAVDTSLDAHALLTFIQSLEARAGRVRAERWGPRTLDLDLLLYGTETIHTDRLTVPHPHIAERNFVLRPLADLMGDDGLLPGGQTLSELLQRCAANALERTELCWSLDTVLDSEPATEPAARRAIP